jgi:hypothetical protein
MYIVEIELKDGTTKKGLLFKLFGKKIEFYLDQKTDLLKEFVTKDLIVNTKKTARLFKFSKTTTGNWFCKKKIEIKREKNVFQIFYKTLGITYVKQ